MVHEPLVHLSHTVEVSTDLGTASYLIDRAGLSPRWHRSLAEEWQLHDMAGSDEPGALAEVVTNGTAAVFRIRWSAQGLGSVPRGAGDWRKAAATVSAAAAEAGIQAVEKPQGYCDRRPLEDTSGMPGWQASRVPHRYVRVDLPEG